VSDVLLSVVEEPVSDTESRSGIEGWVGAVESITIDKGAESPEALF
jgi:hypothetical protein